MAANDYAVIVGISRYPALKDLQGPDQDAKDFYTWLKTRGGVPEENIKLVLSDAPPKPGERPVQEEIDSAFDEIFALAEAKPGRRLYFYFAGHGCSAASDHVALLMANASLKQLNYSLNALSYHEGLARKALFQENVIFYDCCRNYENRVLGRVAPWTIDAPIASAAQVKQFILYGAAFTQYANERLIESELRGLFTKALLEGLNKAVERREGKWAVTTASLVPFVTNRLQELAKAFQLQQKPSRGGGTAEDLVIAEVDQPELFPVTVQGPADGLEVVVKNHRLKEIMRGVVTEGKANFNLTLGLYQFTVANDPDRGVIVEVKPEQPLLVQL
jgi:hypothetical protein